MYIYEHYLTVTHHMYTMYTLFRGMHEVVVYYNIYCVDIVVTKQHVIYNIRAQCHIPQHNVISPNTPRCVTI